MYKLFNLRPEINKATNKLSDVKTGGQLEK